MARNRRPWLWLSVAGALACGETPATTNPYDPRSAEPVEADLQVRMVLPADNLGDLTAPAARSEALETISARLGVDGLGESSTRVGDRHHFTVPPGTYALSIDSTSPALIVPRLDPFVLDVAERRTVEVDLDRRDTVVEGRVLPPEGSPLPAGLRVDLRWAADASDLLCSRGGPLEPATVSGGDWHAQVPTPISGRICVVVRAPGYATLRKSAHRLDPPRSDDSDSLRLRTPDLTLSPSTVDVRVFGASGADPTPFSGPPTGDAQVSSRLVLLAIDGPPGQPIAASAAEAAGTVCGRDPDVVTRIGVQEQGAGPQAGAVLTRPIGGLDETLGALSIPDCAERYPAAESSAAAAEDYIAAIEDAADGEVSGFGRFYCMVDPGPGAKTLAVTLETACRERFSGTAQVHLLGRESHDLELTVEGTAAHEGRWYGPAGPVRLTFSAGGEIPDSGCIGLTVAPLGERSSPLDELACDRARRGGVEFDLARAFACDGGVDPCTGRPCDEAAGDDYCELPIRFDATWIDVAGRTASATRIVVAVRGTPTLALRGAGTGEADEDGALETFHEAPCPIDLPDVMADCIAESADEQAGVEIPAHHRGLLMMKVHTDAHGVDGDAPFSALEVGVERSTAAGWQAVEAASGLRPFTNEPFSVSPNIGQPGSADGRYRVTVSAFDRFGERIPAGDLTVELDQTPPDVSGSGFLTCEACGDQPPLTCAAAGDGCAFCIGPGFAQRAGPSGAPIEVVVPADALLPVLTPDVADETYGVCAWSRAPAEVDDSDGQEPDLRLCSGITLMDPPQLDEGRSGQWYRQIEPFDVACNIGDSVALIAQRDGTPPAVRMADETRPEVTLSCAVRTGPLCVYPGGDNRLNEARWDVGPHRCRAPEPDGPAEGDDPSAGDEQLPAIARLSFELTDEGTAELENGGIRYRVLAVPAPAEGAATAETIGEWIEPMLADVLCPADEAWGQGRAAQCPRQDGDTRCGCVSPGGEAAVELAGLEVVGPGADATTWRTPVVGPCDDGAPIAVRLIVLMEDAVGNRIARLDPLIDRYCPEEDDCAGRRYRVFVDPDALDAAPPEVAAAGLDSPPCLDASDADGQPDGDAGAADAGDAGVDQGRPQPLIADNCELRE